MACCNSCAHNLPCESDCDPGHHHEHGHFEHMEATASDAQHDPLTGMDLSSWQTMERVALAFFQAIESNANPDQAQAEAAEAIGYAHDLGQGAAIVTNYVEGRVRFDLYLAALSTSFAYDRLTNGTTGALTEAGQVEAAYLVDGVNDVAEFTQYAQVRAAVDARLASRCANIDRSVCLGRGGNPEGELAGELRAALLAQSLTLPVYSPPPPVAEVLVAPSEDPFPEVETAPEQSAPTTPPNSSIPSTPPQPLILGTPAPAPKTPTVFVHPGKGTLAGLKTRLAKMIDFAKGNSNNSDDNEARAEANRRRAQSREDFLAQKRAWKLWTNEGAISGGPEVTLAVDVTYPARLKDGDSDVASLSTIERSVLTNSNSRHRRLVTKSVNLQVTHRQWTRLESAYKAARRAGLHRFRTVLQNKAGGSGFTGLEVLAYGLGRLRFDRFQEAALSDADMAYKRNVAKGTRGSIVGKSCVTRRQSGIEVVAKTCLTEQAEEARRFNKFHRSLGRNKNPESIWMKVFESGSDVGVSIVPPPTTRGHFDHIVIGVTRTDDTNGEEGIATKIKAWFGGPEDEDSVLDALDDALDATAGDAILDPAYLLAEPTSCNAGCGHHHATSMDDDDYYHDTEDADEYDDDDDYGEDDFFYRDDDIDDAFYSTAADDDEGLSAKDQLLALELAADQAKAKALVSACVGLDASACVELSKRGFNRVKNAGERLLEADDPSAVALEVAMQGKSSAEPGLLDQVRDVYEEGKREVEQFIGLSPDDNAGLPEVQEQGFLARQMEAWIADVERVLFTEPLAVLEDWHKDLQARWASIKQMLLNALSYLDPRTWFSDDEPEVMAPTASDQADDDDDGVSTALIVAAVTGVLIAGAGAGAAAYIAPHALDAYRDVLTALIENGDDLITAAIPSRAVLDTVGDGVAAAASAFK